ncbi:MAG: type II toxin-antitoxin system prevent-host-death family antitoxin [Nocardiopsaceae bacterium]|nr:type II toxin-antitoxin system prevent-host-death family antitoxin [Nocardiopsaceae bacterium]
MAVMTISEARAVLPEVVNRAAEGEEITITRHGEPAAIVVRPDVIWGQPDTTTDQLIVLLREHARRQGISLREELLRLLDAASDQEPSLAPISLTTVRAGVTGTWSREEIYADDDR